MLMRLLQLTPPLAAVLPSGIPRGRKLRQWGWGRQAGEALEWSEDPVVQVEKGCNAMHRLWVSPARREALPSLSQMEIQLMPRVEVIGMVKILCSVTSTSHRAISGQGCGKTGLQAEILSC